MQKARETLSFAAKTFGEKSDEYKSALEIMKKANEDYEGSANSIINYLDKIVGRVEQANARRGKSEQEYTKTLLEEDKKQALIMVEKLKKTAQFFSFFDKNKGAEILKQALEYEAAIYEDYNNRLSESSKKTTDAAQKITEDRIQNNLELNKSILKANTEYDEKNIIEKQKYEMEMFLLEQQAAIDKLDNLKKYGKITEDEYKRQYAILQNNQTKFYNDQTKALAEHSKKLHEEIKKMLQSDTENQIEETTAKYQDAIKQLQNENENLSKSAGVDLSNVSDVDSILIDPKVLEQHKENMAKIAGLQTALEKRIVEIKKQGLEEQAQIIDKKLDEMYSEQFNKAAHNELKNLELEKEMLEKRIAMRKEAGITDNSEDEAAQKANEIKTIQANAQLELALTAKTEKQKYDIKRKALEDELKLYDAGTLEYANTLEAMRNLDAEFQASQLEKWTEYADYAMQAFEQIAQIMANASEVRVQELETQNTQEKDNLKKMLDANLISQSEYDEKVKKSDEKLAKEKAKIARKQAIMEKAMSIAQIAMNTAQSIMASAKMGFPAAIPFIAMAAVLGAIQTAAVASQPIPQAAKGRLIGGQSHAQGGTLIEAERGEAIINKRSTGMYPELLSLINEMGGGVPFTRSYSDGGFAMREYRRNQSPAVDTEAITQTVVEAVKNIQIYTAIEDIRKGNDQYITVTGESGIGELG
jgi:hypothetical protein